MFLSDEYSLHNALPCELQVRFEKNYGPDRWQYAAIPRLHTIVGQSAVFGLNYVNPLIHNSMKTLTLCDF